MSATVSIPTPGRWVALLLRRQPHQIIGNHDAPYLQRWYLIPHNRVINLYLHKFLSSDDDRALHDHPWWFASLILRGQYIEVSQHGRRRRRPGSVAFRPATFRHRVELIRDSHRIPACDDMNPKQSREKPCWTVILTGPRRRGWGFWCPRERFVPWQNFGAGGCGENQDRP
ncbi:hypothetical protein MFM001_47220 [Mycobacterium sp. MFM001]|uniref:hypothetical protein n=1 Tax=Mycobacterium sp. MFM001 TaxID=2049453 RepID=UPI000DA58430|nr:hypothetical protein [Mycobacterium sp. MFM001]GBE68260.1 hypothetical protein MFM001_47220 [Mycobacterium sp. MFM001]